MIQKLYTTISPNYVPSWGIREGIREIIQNGLDSEDNGHTLIINYIKEKKQLRISNENASIEMKDLLLGETDKSDNPKQRGQHGEGFKVGALALIRLGKEVSIWNGPEKNIITFSFDEHPDCLEPVLVFNTEHQNYAGPTADRLTFVIDNLAPEEYKSVQDIALKFNGLGLGDYHSTSHGQILTKESLKGCLYVGDLFICKDSALDYGYNFNMDKVELDRDRTLIREFDLQYTTAMMWSQIAGKGTETSSAAVDMIKKDAKDTQYIGSFPSEKIQEKLVADFKASGADNYPVTNDYESKEVSELGLDPVITNPVHAHNLKNSLGSISDMKEKLDPVKKRTFENWVEENFPDIHSIEDLYFAKCAWNYVIDNKESVDHAS